MIESVTYCQICGSKLEKHISETIRHPYCHTCKKISYLDPKVATVIIIENNSTILLYRSAIALRGVMADFTTDFMRIFALLRPNPA